MYIEALQGLQRYGNLSRRSKINNKEQKDAVLVVLIGEIESVSCRQVAHTAFIKTHSLLAITTLKAACLARSNPPKNGSRRTNTTSRKSMRSDCATGTKSCSSWPSPPAPFSLFPTSASGGTLSIQLPSELPSYTWHCTL